MKINLTFKYKNLLEFLENASPFTPEIAIVLGSGLGDFASSVETKISIPTTEIPDYPPSTIPGHAGKIHFSEYAGKKLLLFQGRIHFYEGYNIDECILPSLITKHLGSSNILITNAAGGINHLFKPGDLMLADSFIGFSIKKEISGLFGLADESAKNNFLNFPSKKINKIIRQAALEESLPLKEGIYWYTKGPSYETPAEIKMMQRLGADAIGMSTVHEAIAAAYWGIESASITCITNFAAGISSKKLDHKEVTETANLVKEKFEKLVKKTIELI